MKKFGLLLAMVVITLIAGGALIYAVSVTPMSVLSAPSSATAGISTTVSFTPPATKITATPFQPVPITPTPSQTPVPTESPTEIPLSPTETPPIPEAEVPPSIPWDNGIEIPEGQVKILVLGSDVRPGGGFRTDVMILLIINPQNGSASVVSFPRDLYVFIPGWGMNRLNTAMQIGGFSTMADTFEYNFGIRPDHYVLTNFQGFTSIINSVGEITVEVGQNFSDKCDLWWATGGICSVEAGTRLMDGETALWYARARYSTSDFDRTRRQQEILQGLFRRMMHIDAVLKAPEFYEYYRENVETSLSLEDMLPLAKVAPALLQSEQIRRYAIGPGEVYDFINEYGAWVLVPNPYAVQSVLQQALSDQ